jgi:hypothetical protein
VRLPDNSADRLISAYVAEAVPRRTDGERTREILAGLGFDVTQEGSLRLTPRCGGCVTGSPRSSEPRPLNCTHR